MMHSVFFDVDGTLIDTATKQVPDSTYRAIDELHAKGIKVFIASGRDIQNLKQSGVIDLSYFDGFVTSNGMALFTAEFEKIKMYSFDNAVVKQLLDIAMQSKMPLLFEEEHSFYMANEYREFVKEAMEYYQETTPPCKKWTGNPIIKVTAFAPKNHDWKEISALSNVKVMPSPSTCADLLLIDIDKITGIHEILRFYGLPETGFICFGDHINDFDMIKAADIGIAVKDINGSKELQKLANYVCEAPNDDGIYNILKQLNII